MIFSVRTDGELDLLRAIFRPRVTVVVYSPELSHTCAISLRCGSLRVKVKVHTLDIAPLRSESPPQKRSGMARVLNGFHSFTCTPTVPHLQSAIGMSRTSRSWYSFTDPGWMEG